MSTNTDDTYFQPGEANILIKTLIDIEERCQTVYNRIISLHLNKEQSFRLLEEQLGDYIPKDIILNKLI